MSAADSSATALWRIQAQGDRCLLIRFGDTLDIRTGQTCLAAARLLRDAALPGVTDIVPSFTAVAVHYLPGIDGPSHAQMAERVAGLFAGGIAIDEAAGRDIEIPVCYGGDLGPDLPEVAACAGIGEEDVVALHTQPGCMVFMLGFAPGFAYIGGHDEKLAIARRDTPRLNIPAGSVAIANRQSVIYPGGLPGGWSIIGATPLVLFDPSRSPAALLAPGDRVRFRSVDRKTYESMKRGDGR
ncbi:5-oxoprolinase subunit PxpB [Bordetella sp. FB-8]|uniref:5-oxoprolinase subunit PxpB n=1 Tax=Bordetella sp. FB-8 TaxID=1159870 RepID=UPI00035FFD11|nr:5-oxoprolinase subunit PxpB [Bordetella sp. FB-8]